MDLRSTVKIMNLSDLASLQSEAEEIIPKKGIKKSCGIFL